MTTMAGASSTDDTSEDTAMPSAEVGLGAGASDVEEFEIGHHHVPWFLWLFFALIVTWASVSWIKFFGY